jgi:hypothetical protein
VKTRSTVHLIPAQRLDQLEETREHALLVHHLESQFILSTVEEKE